MKRLFLSLGLAVAAGFVATVPAHATALLYDFENQPLTIETPFTLQSSGVAATFVGTGDDAFGGAFSISSNFQTSTGFLYRLMSGDFLTIGSAFGAAGSPLTIFFSAPITAFSVAFALDDPSNRTSLAFTTNAGGVSSATGALTAGFHYPEGILSFSGQAFTAITFSTAAIDFQLDNLRATTLSVPEPGSLWLIGAAIPAITFFRRRRQSKNA